jgi:predicted dehydrogenase
VQKKLGVGIIGLQPEHGWAARAHVPALRALSNDFQIVGVANRSAESARRAASYYDIEGTVGDVDDLVASSDVDIVTVTVRVPGHFSLVKRALEAGKNVYCEWPLGRSRAEAEELAGLARDRGVLGVIGTQARVTPAVVYLRNLVSSGQLGTVLSTTIRGWGRGWGAAIESAASEGYLLDPDNGATLVTIPIGHTMSAVRDIFGDIADLSSLVDSRRGVVRDSATGEAVPMSAPDEVAFIGHFASGVPFSVHYRGGVPRDEPGLSWDIQGTEADVRVTAEPSGHVQMVPLHIQLRTGREERFRDVAVPEEPGAIPDDAIAGNVARLYARMAGDLRAGTSNAPTFDDAVALHHVVDAIVGSTTLTRLPAAAANRLLP